MNGYCSSLTLSRASAWFKIEWARSSNVSGTTDALNSFTFVLFVEMDSTPAETNSYPAVVVVGSNTLSPLTSKLIDVLRLCTVIGSSVD